MNESIRILFVEDMPTDAELAAREIRRALKSCVFQRVETREDYLAALVAFQPDLIISDYRMPRFDGLTALKLALERMPLTPVIILTGAMNEDTAVECMKAGAIDYVIKEHFKRLGQAVLRALEEKQLRQERHRTEEALRESEERYRTLAEAANDIIFIIGADDTYRYLNGFGAKLLGFQPQDMVGRRRSDFFPPSIAAQQTRVMQKVLEIGEPGYDESLIPTPTGGTWLNTLLVPLKGKAGEVDAVLGISRDITERKRAEEQLLYQANLLQNVSDAIIATDLKFNITSWNQAAEALYGWKAGEVIGWSIDDVLQTEYVDPQPEPILSQLLEQGVWKGESTQKHKDGTAINILASVSLIKDSAGQSVGAVAVNRDITTRKQAEEVQAKLEAQLRQAQKMESIGRLAGGVAHDFNNLLTVIQGYCSLMQAKISTRDPLLKDLEQIWRAGDRAAALTRQLLAFGRKQILAPTPLDLNSLVANLRKMLERLIGEDITLSTVLSPELWSVTADPGQIEQVIMNLVVNARDAMPTGGMLTIETGNVYLNDNYALTRPDAPAERPYVMLTVTDTGCGMDEPTLAQIFEPFFTTKEPGKGTGLGLATAYGIIMQSGGDITAHSEPNRGTTFKIYLPANKTIPNRVTTTPSIHRATSGGNETILLVEDEEMVRDLMRVALQDKGYTILEARHGVEALSLYGQPERPLDLLVTDVVMPQMSGRELAERLKALHPRVKILFISGYTDDAVVRHGLLTAEVEFLPKPFSPNELASKVREVLDQ